MKTFKRGGARNGKFRYDSKKKKKERVKKEKKGASNMPLRLR